MENDLIIPVNIFAEYFQADPKRQLALLKQHWKSVEKQKLKKKGESNPVYGNTARSQICRTILAGMDHSLTKKTLKNVRALMPGEDEKWQRIDQKVNISILERFQGMSIPEILIGNKLEKVLPTDTIMPFYGINIKIVPSLAFRIDYNGMKQLGACKIHASKQHPFSLAESKIVAALLFAFLSNYVVEEAEVVNPDLCFCIDPYAGTTVLSNRFFPSDMKIVQNICDELRSNWEMVIRNRVA